jgi:precorrin-2 dehydrogenase/sirohydrochlorin ferrochelatase
VGKLRRKLRDTAPAAKDGPKRMKWISQICETWTLEELIEMDDQHMEMLLEYYSSDKVPTFQQVGLVD